jgi:uncharacterized protein (TIGR04255 family)
MLGQVQFPPVLRLQKGVEVVADLQDEIRSEFPGFAVENQFQVALVPSPEGEPLTTRALGYRFATGDNRWSALLSPTALTLEAMAGGRYSSYRDFASLFALLWAAVLKHVSPSTITRQGLRYVDHIEEERSPQQWAELVNPVLLGPLLDGPLGDCVERTVTELVYSWEPGRMLIFRHGISMAGPSNAKGYLLDFDSVHLQHLGAGDVEVVMTRFEESHELLYDFFRWCVTDKAVEVFKSAGS